MFKSKKIEIVVLFLVFALLLGSSSSVVAAPDDRPDSSDAQVITGYVSLIGANFVPYNPDTSTVLNYGNYILTFTASTEYFSGAFTIPSGHVIKKFTLYALDENASSNGCATLFISNPATQSKIDTKTGCTTGSSATVQVVTNFVSKTITQHKVPFIWIETYQNIKIYGVKIGYE